MLAAAGPIAVDDFYAIAAVLGVAAAVGVLARLAGQPLIVAYIAVGILVGPVGFGWVVGGDDVDLLARLGIAVLLFLVGLKLDLQQVRVTGPVAVATRLGQVAFTSLIGFLLALGLGMSNTAALYVAVALTFSSTIIIVKLLSDKRELDELHGRIAVGFLIVQDIVVVLVMIALTAFGGAGDDSVVHDAVAVIGKGVGLLVGLGFMMRFVLPPLMRTAARAGELVILVSVAWAVGFAAFTGWLGFSTEVGAFLAGVSLAGLEYRDAVGARLVGLRDFLLLFFFVDLGSRLEFADAPRQILDASVLSVFVLVGNPVIVMVILGAMRYRKRVSFLVGLSVAQISEFSLILVGLGVSLGHIGASTVTLVTLVGLVTIGLSTYMITYSHVLYRRLERVLSVFERARPVDRELAALGHQPDVVLFGLGRYGGSVAAALAHAGHDVLAIDFDPTVASRLDQPGLTVVYGDAEDPEMPAALPIAGAQWVISTVPVASTNLALVRALRDHGYRGRIALAAFRDGDSETYAGQDVELVLRPFHDAAADVVSRLEMRGDNTRRLAAEPAERAPARTLE
jgi:Kef-type K+ transport system membrane component KefB